MSNAVDDRGARPQHSHWGWVTVFLRFITVGLMNTAVELVVYNALLAVHNPHNLQILTVYSTLGVVAAIANSYLWNSRWAFRAARVQGREAIRQRALFIAQALVNIAINDLVTVAITPVLTGWEFWPRVVAQNVAKVVAMCTSSVSSFMMLSWLVFNPAMEHGAGDHGTGGQGTGDPGTGDHGGEPRGDGAETPSDSQADAGEAHGPRDRLRGGRHAMGDR